MIIKVLLMREQHVEKLSTQCGRRCREQKRKNRLACR
jgi:hypothetical protein